MNWKHCRRILSLILFLAQIINPLFMPNVLSITFETFPKENFPLLCSGGSGFLVPSSISIEGITSKTFQSYRRVSSSNQFDSLLPGMYGKLKRLTNVLPLILLD